MRQYWREVWDTNPMFFIAMALLLAAIAFVCIIAVWIVIIAGS